MTSKTILIHAGPPKTGTSVIQSWLNNNVEALAEQGFFYPRHDLDSNQISSGNYAEVLDIDNNKKVSFSEKKFLTLVNHFEQSDAHTLLLSSEYFFKQIPQFKQYPFRYEFVVYLRPAIAFVESIYNQSVKRNGNDAVIAIRENIQNPFHGMLNSYIKQFGPEEFNVRVYGDHTVLGKTLVEDFAQGLHINKKLIEPGGNYINRSYCFEALEIKRRLNRYFGKQLDRELDPILQQYSGGEYNYSLIPKKTFEGYKAQSLAEITAIAQLVTVANKEKLISSLQTMVRKPYRHQTIGNSAAQKLLTYIAEQNSDLFRHVATTLASTSVLPRDKNIQEIVSEVLEITTRKTRTSQGWFARLSKLFR
jgi:hypothetical protein